MSLCSAMLHGHKLGNCILVHMIYFVYILFVGSLKIMNQVLLIYAAFKSFISSVSCDYFVKFVSLIQTVKFIDIELLTVSVKSVMMSPVHFFFFLAFISFLLYFCIGWT